MCSYKGHSNSEVSLLPSLPLFYAFNDRLYGVPARYQMLCWMLGIRNEPNRHTQETDIECVITEVMSFWTGRSMMDVEEEDLSVPGLERCGHTTLPWGSDITVALRG